MSRSTRSVFSSFFFFNDTATTEIYTLSLHDALPIFNERLRRQLRRRRINQGARCRPRHVRRSEEHTSELQSQSNLVCRLLLEKKKKIKKTTQNSNNTNTNLPTLILAVLYVFLRSVIM